MSGLSKLGTMDQTQVGVDALLSVVVKRLWQVPALCIKCEPVHVLGTNVARKVLLPLKVGAKRKETTPFQAPFLNPPLPVYAIVPTGNLLSVKPLSGFM